MAKSTITDFIFSWTRQPPAPKPRPRQNLDVDIHYVDRALGKAGGMMVWGTPYKKKESDLTVLVGQEERKFEVHTRLFAAKSKFFKAACSTSHFREGVEHLVRLPEIDVESMKRIVAWFYDSRLTLPTDIFSDEGYEITLNLLNAADFLEIPIVINIITKATQNYIWKCNSWKEDAEEAAADEQKKVDLMCRLYECGGKIDAIQLNAYLKNLRDSHKMGLFINAVKEVEDCHPGFFNDTMVARNISTNVVLKTSKYSEQDHWLNVIVRWQYNGSLSYHSTLVHRDVIDEYSPLISNLLLEASKFPRGRDAPPVKITIPCNSRITFHRIIAWMYHRKLGTKDFPWPETRDQLLNWPQMREMFHTADSLHMRELTVELREQLTSALIHHARVLPFREDPEFKVDTSPTAICRYINQVYNYKGRIGMHGLIHVLLSTKSGQEIRDIVERIRDSEDRNEEFFRLLEFAGREVEIMAKEKCSCLWIDRNMRTA
ncbi:hypothetical protein TWF191_002382 [Orbilia oligospora]|uniref:BTB domain-containing protein n=1 Tax=Orbilia oligospora TaxID=2813651 RepID=A0A7C8QZF2_ORBOL|nr:hypothetical protein TWF191_002382 [Orbilia oligospora]